MKKKIFLIAVIVLLLSLVGYGTYAYTTVEGRATNVITTGGIHIALVETRSDGSKFPTDGVFHVLPGTEESKIVNVTNTDSESAWVRVRVSFDVTLADGSKPADGFHNFTLEGTTPGDWELVSEKSNELIYYYKNQLAGNCTTASPVFKAVGFAPEMGNEYQGSTVNVCVQAQAVQAKNNGETWADAKGWPEAE